MHIGHRVQRRRQQLGWTQQDVEQASSIPQSVVSRIERGVLKNPGADVIRRLAKALGVTSDWLIGMYEEDEEDEDEPSDVTLVG